MGNLFASPVPETEEFATEFLRVQAAVAALPAEPDSQGDIESCQLRLQFVQLKIACAQYWLHKARIWARFHESQLEQEKLALQEGQAVLESSLPAIDEVPQTVDVEGCTPCDGCMGSIDEVDSFEPLVRHSQDSATGLTDFYWLPCLGCGGPAIGPDTSPAATRGGSARQPVDGCGDARSLAGSSPDTPDHAREAGVEARRQGMTDASLVAASGTSCGTDAGASAAAGTTSSLPHVSGAPVEQLPCSCGSAAVYLGVAVVGYWAWGNSVSGFVLAMSTHPTWLLIVTNLMSVSQLLVAEQVCEYVLYETGELALVARFPWATWLHKQRLNSQGRRVQVPSRLTMLLVRVPYIAVITTIAATFPFFTQIMGLVGALGLTPLCLVLPPVLYVMARGRGSGGGSSKGEKGSTGLSPLAYWANVSAAVVWAGVGLLAAIGSVRAIVVAIEAHDFYS
ncbi:hypothetical protein D9Q98_006323 [Chlorella vulgaris]|uniref:Amino acid transporter transmembrane domain-containing protein n=1 Tax=Chlorella vulgaris TaxID=3077 RepID=A0A9D4YUX1_CHLVU|nr:hypothetical protein D9Q98_006323 [Chlorella vulgaris]